MKSELREQLHGNEICMKKVQFIHGSQEFGDLSPFLPFQMLCKVYNFV